VGLPVRKEGKGIRYLSKWVMRSSPFLKTCRKKERRKPKTLVGIYPENSLFRNKGRGKGRFTKGVDPSGSWEGARVRKTSPPMGGGRGRRSEEKSGEKAIFL